MTHSGIAVLGPHDHATHPSRPVANRVDLKLVQLNRAYSAITGHRHERR